MPDVRFYFSFRSPYSWFAFHRIGKALEGLPVEVERVPVFPTADRAAAVTPTASKLRYVAEDVRRFAEAYGLALRWPKNLDTAWIRPHTAYLFADDRGRGEAFGLAAYDARFSQGRDLGEDDVLRDVATASGVDPGEVLRAADDPALQGRVFAGMAAAVETGMFGVPYFIYRDRRFWGNDRLDWLVRDILKDLGRPQPDLGADPLATPFHVGEPGRG